jgi:glyceraldehyde 3-phosphate dehydrogenase
MTKVAINGFGRIGRNFLRASLDRRAGFEIVALNDLGDLKTMAHLLQFDSILGRFPEEVAVDSDTISVGEHRVRAFSVPEPADLPWRELGVEWSSRPPDGSSNATRHRRTSMPAQTLS